MREGKDSYFMLAYFSKEKVMVLGRFFFEGGEIGGIKA